MSSFKALCKFDFVLEYICHFMLAERQRVTGFTGPPVWLGSHFLNLSNVGAGTFCAFFSPRSGFCPFGPPLITLSLTYFLL